MRTESEFKDNLAAYWRKLNEACGVPPGTHPDDPNPAAPAQSRRTGEPTYAASTSVLADPGFEGVYASLLRDPDVQALLHEHNNDIFVPNALGPTPNHPQDQLRWYILRDLNEFHHKRHLADFKDAKKHRTRQRTEYLVSKLKEHDPLFALTREVMDFYDEGLAPTALRAKRATFERSPHEAIEYYREMRRIAQKVVAKRSARHTTPRGGM